jgi:transcription elongation GreA/GreB family factor
MTQATSEENANAVSFTKTIADAGRFLDITFGVQALKEDPEQVYTVNINGELAEKLIKRALRDALREATGGRKNNTAEIRKKIMDDKVKRINADEDRTRDPDYDDLRDVEKLIDRLEELPHPFFDKLAHSDIIEYLTLRQRYLFTHFDLTLSQIFGEKEVHPDDWRWFVSQTPTETIGTEGDIFQITFEAQAQKGDPKQVYIININGELATKFLKHGLRRFLKDATVRKKNSTAKIRKNIMDDTVKQINAGKIRIDDPDFPDSANPQGESGTKPKKELFTKVGLDRLKAKLTELKSKERQPSIEAKIAKLEDIISRAKLAEIIDTAKLNGATVTFGTSVLVADEETDQESEYAIVGLDETDAYHDSFLTASPSSPMGKALIGGQVGDSVEVNIPTKGKRFYEIVKISVLKA